MAVNINSINARNVIIGKNGNADPFWGNVRSLVHFDDTPGTTTPFDIAGLLTWVNFNSTYNYVSNIKSKFGTGSFARTGNEYANINPSGLRTNVGAIGNVYTIEFFIQFNLFSWSNSTSNRFFYMADAALQLYMLVQSPSPLSNGTFMFYENQTPINHPTSAAAILNTWHYIAYCSDGTHLYIFIDGILAYTHPTTFSFSLAPVYLSVGAASGVNGDYFNGFTDEFRFTSGVCRYTPASPPVIPIQPFPNF